jgi:hypothetical protein
MAFEAAAEHAHEDRVPVPPAVWVCGLATLVPFIVCSILFCYGPIDMRPVALISLMAYSTAMLSYLGGVRCGLEIERPSPRWMTLGLSLLSPLAGFGLLLGGLKFEPAWQLSGFLLVFILQWLWDVTDHEGPAWRPRLRTLLTSGAAISLALALEQALHL